MENNLMMRTRQDDLLTQELHSLLSTLGTNRYITKGSFLFQEGMEARHIYVVKSGLVKIGKLAENGKELTLRICEQNDIFGELIMFTDQPTYFLNASVIESGDVIVIHKDEFEHELMQNSTLSFEFMKWTSNQMRKFQYKMRDLILYGKKGALYSTLIRLSNSYGIKQDNGILININLTNQELAGFCAASRENINRMLVYLRKQNVISMDDSGKILIKDMHFLRNAVGCEFCPIEICDIK